MYSPTLKNCDFLVIVFPVLQFIDYIELIYGNCFYSLFWKKDKKKKKKKKKRKLEMAFFMNSLSYNFSDTKGRDTT